jgi:hypothetical protein
VALAVSPSSAQKAAAPLLEAPVLLRWWHMLSLDAPTVAAVWAWSFAGSFHIRLPLYSIAILTLGTWILYIADRVLDGWRTLPLQEMRERHYFHLRHWRTLLICCGAVSVLLIWLILARMQATARREDTLLFLAALAYFFAVHFKITLKRWFSKELLVGIIFAAATAVPVWSRLQHHPPSLITAVTLFAAVCWLNCTAIERWESIGHIRYPYFSVAAVGVAVLSFLSCCFAQRENSATAELFAAEMISACLLLFLDLSRARLTPMFLRVAADLVLLTPLLILPFAS